MCAQRGAGNNYPPSLPAYLPPRLPSYLCLLPPYPSTPQATEADKERKLAAVLAKEEGARRSFFDEEEEEDEPGGGGAGDAADRLVADALQKSRERTEDAVDGMEDEEAAAAAEEAALLAAGKAKPKHPQGASAKGEGKHP